MLAAGDWRAGDGGGARKAMNELATQYWFPLYAYLRRQGHSPAAAEDLVQGFFTHLLEKDAISTVDRSKGKFRSFLLASLKNFVRDDWDKRRAAKRSFDTRNAEVRYAAEPIDTRTPEHVFERRWAHAIVDQVLTGLRDDYAARNQSEIFAALRHLLVGGPGERHAQIAAQLGMTEAAVKVAAHRLRRRYRELLREEIGQTVSDPALIDEEIRQLLNSL